MQLTTTQRPQQSHQTLRRARNCSESVSKMRSLRNKPELKCGLHMGTWHPGGVDVCFQSSLRTGFVIHLCSRLNYLGNTPIDSNCTCLQSVCALKVSIPRACYTDTCIRGVELSRTRRCRTFETSILEKVIRCRQRSEIAIVYFGVLFVSKG